jgi:hypothetical protein
MSEIESSITPAAEFSDDWTSPGPPDGGRGASICLFCWNSETTHRLAPPASFDPEKA